MYAPWVMPLIQSNIVFDPPSNPSKCFGSDREQPFLHESIAPHAIKKMLLKNYRKVMSESKRYEKYCERLVVMHIFNLEYLDVIPNLNV